MAPDAHFRGARFDDAAGFAPILVVRERATSHTSQVSAVALSALESGREAFEAMMASAPALLVRPDRYVFGVGDAAALLSGWSAYLANGEVAAPAAAA